MKSRTQQEGALPPRVSGGVAHAIPRLSSSNGNEGHWEHYEGRAVEFLPDEIVAPEIREKINLLQSNHKRPLPSSRGRYSLWPRSMALSAWACSH